MQGDYRQKYEKHVINTVDENQRINLTEITIEQFAVKLKISADSKASNELSDERKRQMDNLRCAKVDDIDMDKLIDGENRVTFVRGTAGMGKSVLAKQLAYGWANGMMYTDYNFCIMFECRVLNKFKKESKNSDLEDRELLSKFLKENFNCYLGDGEGVLFIVDGLDELYDINSDSIIWYLLDYDKSRYIKSKIILLGRPNIEHELDRSKTIGGLRRVKIVGLSDEQIESFIMKYPFKTNTSIMDKIKDSLEIYRETLQVPQFLNTFCCVAILTNGETIQNPAELYCWNIFCLLVQHAGCPGSSSFIPGVFKTYSESLLVLSNICYDLLKKNIIIFEGDVTNLFCNLKEGATFAKSLFEPVPDCYGLNYQFTHLSLMEFLSAIHICNSRNPFELIKEKLKEKLSDDILFVCRLMAGVSSSKIIAHLLSNVAITKNGHDKQFLSNLLKVIRECKLDRKEFSYSIQILVYFLNKDPNKQEDLASKIALFDFSSVEANALDTNNVMHICKHLSKESPDNIKEAFKDLSFRELEVSNEENFRYIKLFKITGGIRLLNMQLNSAAISEFRKEILGNCNWVEIANCEFKDETYDQCGSTAGLNKLTINSCVLNLGIFKKLCGWGVSSKVFEVWDIAMDDDWWNELAFTMEKIKKTGELLLRTLDIKQLPNQPTNTVQRRVGEVANYL